MEELYREDEHDAAVSGDEIPALGPTSAFGRAVAAGGEGGAGLDGEIDQVETNGGEIV